MFLLTLPMSIPDDILALADLLEQRGAFHQAMLLRSGDPGALNELGIHLMQSGELAAAVACFQQALISQPDFVEAGNNLGLALMGQGHVEEAEQRFREALLQRPDLAGLHNNLGLSVLNQGRLTEAQAHFEAAIRIQPDLADAHNSLGQAFEEQGRPDEALACFEQAIAIDPDHCGALANLGNSLKNQGLADAAVTAFRRALALRADDAAIHSNLLLTMQYQSSADPQELLGEARRFAARHANHLSDSVVSPRLRTRPDRRLRIGYVSADLRDHPVSYFLEPILAAHARSGFQIFCYADVPRPDAVTERLGSHVEQWRALTGLSDAAAAEMIRQDEIDVLVDLHGHTAGNRLLTFAHRPAPVLASYLGYLGTSGLAAMDYYVTDEHADPPGAAEAVYQESIIRLPGCAFCYWPGPAPEVAATPAAGVSSHVTFGCLNSPAKVNDQVLTVWSGVLKAVPDSRLILATAGSKKVEARFRAGLTGLGVTPDRLLVAGPAASRIDNLKNYRHIDIALDPFPYNGVTTTCDALWMGVPVISLIGGTSTARQGVRFLRCVGLDELLASTSDDYVAMAARLAGDPRWLETLHSTLRQRMRSSALMDAEGLTRNLEAAFLAMCDGRSVDRQEVRDP
jgi:predicted O-linked N-acetylglucosamine transferase (SPINDLY family)